jgi:hypothetical protein
MGRPVAGTAEAPVIPYQWGNVSLHAGAGGNRIEVMGDPGYMIFAPVWKTVVWKGSELDVGAAWTGSPMPDSFWSYGTPLAAELLANPQKVTTD